MIQTEGNYKLDLKDVDPKVAELTKSLRIIREALESTGLTREEADRVIDPVMDAMA
jgi:hypothetical protein